MKKCKFNISFDYLSTFVPSIYTYRQGALRQIMNGFCDMIDDLNIKSKQDIAKKKIHSSWEFLDCCGDRQFQKKNGIENRIRTVEENT